MPIGLITDCSSVLLGGLAGAAMGPKLKKSIRDNVTTILGFSAIAIGVNSIIKANAMTPVVIAVIFGTLFGEFIDLERNITARFGLVIQRFPHDKEAFDMDQFITVAVLFCASGFGLYGVLVEGMSGDPSILLSKAVLDFCTAAVFAVSLGALVAFVALPMAVIMGALFLLAGLLSNVVTAPMLQDFMACGGVLTLAAGLRIGGIKKAPIANMIPVLPLVLPVSALWTALMG